MARVKINMSHFVLQVFCWFSAKWCIGNWCLCFNSHRYSFCASVKTRHLPGGGNLFMDYRQKLYFISFKQKTTLSSDSERLRFARQSNIQWVTCFCGIRTAAFISVVQWGRKEEFNGPVIHCSSEKFVLYGPKWLQDLLLLSNCCWTSKSSSTKAQPKQEFEHMKDLKFINRSFVLAGGLILVHFIDKVQVNNIFVYSRYWRFF